MADVRACKKCGNQFERTFGSNRLHCYACSPARITGADASGTVHPIRADVPPTLVPPSAPSDVDSYVPQPHTDAPHTPGRVELHTVAELTRLGALETLEGALALGFASALDDQWLPGAQRTSMTKQLQIVIEGIRATIPAELDGVDAYAEAARRLREQAG